ncbi:MAG: ATP-binding protein [Kiritimatiellae bacterium]|nr:ATP-binding protein [Kiritimatiellia bacterium]
MRLFKREQYLSRIRGFYDSTDLIKVISGVRRAGKSSLMQMIADELRTRNVPESNLIFLNLDKRGFRGVKSQKQLEDLIASQSLANGTKYLFIDEIQNVEGFEEVLNGFREENEYSIFITGSNSYLLSGELATKLTGRYIEFEIFPLNFVEYEEMKAFYGKTIDTNPLAELNSFILEGGFPRALLFDDIDDKRKYTEELVREIFEKDIRRRVKIKNKETFEAVRNFLINNFGAEMSVRSLRNALEGAGVTISEATASRYVSALVNAKVLCECPRFDLKSKRSLRGGKKHYLSDLSFFFAQNTDNTINYGPVLENIFFTYLKGVGRSVSVGKIGTLECDFIVRTAPMAYAYFQIAYTILSSKDTEDREFRALEHIRDGYPKYVLTADYLLQRRNGIIHENILDFMKRNSFSSRGV